MTARYIKTVSHDCLVHQDFFSWLLGTSRLFLMTAWYIKTVSHDCLVHQDCFSWLLGTSQLFLMTARYIKTVSHDCLVHQDCFSWLLGTSRLISETIYWIVKIYALCMCTGRDDIPIVVFNAKNRLQTRPLNLEDSWNWNIFWWRFLCDLKVDFHYIEGKKIICSVIPMTLK